MIIEVRAAEGGQHSKLLVLDQLSMYRKLAIRRGFSLEVIENRPGIVVFRVTGKDAGEVFANESGGHRIQCIPPTERSGRVQTSTITVATFREPDPSEFSIHSRDLEYSTTRSGGKGGQNANKVESCVILKHLPTGLTVRIEDERSQYRNKEIALAVLTARLFAMDKDKRSSIMAADRKSQVGSGQRGDKRRTIRVKDGDVVDHITGKRWKYGDYIRGIW